MFENEYLRGLRAARSAIQPYANGEILLDSSAYVAKDILAEIESLIDAELQVRPVESAASMDARPTRPKGSQATDSATETLSSLAVPDARAEGPTTKPQVCAKCGGAEDKDHEFGFRDHAFVAAPGVEDATLCHLCEKPAKGGICKDEDDTRVILCHACGVKVADFYGRARAVRERDEALAKLGASAPAAGSAPPLPCPHCGLFGNHLSSCEYEKFTAMFKGDPMQTQTLDPTTVQFPWEPVDDRVVVLPLLQATPSAEGSAGLVLTDQNRERPMIGIVLVAGPGGLAPETGRPVPVNSVAGQLVAFGRYAGLDFEAATLAGHLKVLIMRDCDALLRRPAGSYELVVHEDNPAKMHEAGYVCDLCRPKPEPVVLEEAAAEAPAAATIDPELEQAAAARIAAERERLRQSRAAQETPAPSPFAG